MIRRAVVASCFLVACASPPGPARVPAPTPVAPPPPPPALPAPAYTSCERPPPATTLALAWRAEPHVSLFWTIEQLSGWDDVLANEPYLKAWSARFPAPEEGDASRLETYRKLRRKYAREPSEPEVDRDMPFDMLPPSPEHDAAGRFAAAFSCHGDPAVAGRSIGMTPDEARSMAEVFAGFRLRQGAILRDAPWLERARRRFDALAAETRTAEFLDAMAKFYGLSRLPGRVYVDFVWGPPGVSQATTFGDHMLIPISEKMAADDKELSSWLGVIVHELGHSFLGRVAEANRRKVSNRIVGEVGVIRQRHSNLVDEATQASLGNLLFLRERLPSALDEAQVYNYEPGSDYPDAIDSLARAIERHAKAALHQPGAFGTTFLDRVLEEHRRLFPPRLDHHARVGFVIGDRPALRWFRGLFWGRSRTQISLDDAGIASFKPAIARWALLTSEDLARRAELPRAIGMPWTAALAAKAAKAENGCVAAERNGDGWDIAVVGRDASGLRRTLIGISRGILRADATSAHPVCLR